MARGGLSLRAKICRKEGMFARVRGGGRMFVRWVQEQVGGIRGGAEDIVRREVAGVYAASRRRVEGVNEGGGGEMREPRVVEVMEFADIVNGETLTVGEEGYGVGELRGRRMRVGESLFVVPRPDVGMLRKVRVGGVDVRLWDLIAGCLDGEGVGGFGRTRVFRFYEDKGIIRDQGDLRGIAQANRSEDGRRMGSFINRLISDLVVDVLAGEFVYSSFLCWEMEGLSEGKFRNVPVGVIILGTRNERLIRMLQLDCLRRGNAGVL